MVHVRNLRTLEDLILAVTKKNFIEEAYGIDYAKLKAWFKLNGVLIATVSIVGFSFGYYRAQSTLALDCKYAKAIRIDTEAYECKRIL